MPATAGCRSRTATAGCAGARPARTATPLPVDARSRGRARRVRARVRQPPAVPRRHVPARGSAAGGPAPLRREGPPAQAAPGSRARRAPAGARSCRCCARPPTTAPRRLTCAAAPAPDNPWLAWALHLAHTTAEARGWQPCARRTMQRILVSLLAGHRDGEPIAASAVHAVATRRSLVSHDAVEILAAMEVLHDDRPDLFAGWLDAKLAGLAAGLASEARRWALTLHDGGPRTPATRPRHRPGLPARRPASAAVLVGPLRPPARGHPRRRPRLYRGLVRSRARTRRLGAAVPVHLGEEDRRDLPQPGDRDQARRTRPADLAATGRRAARRGRRCGDHPAGAGLRGPRRRARRQARRGPSAAARRRRPGEPTPAPGRHRPADGRADLQGPARMAGLPAAPVAAHRQPTPAGQQGKRTAPRARSAAPGSSTCGACPPLWSGCGSTASSPRPWPPGSTRSTSPRCSASASKPRSATRSTPSICSDRRISRRPGHRELGLRWDTRTVIGVHGR